MTIKVTIENSDTRESAVIEIEVCSRDAPGDLQHAYMRINPTGQVKLLRGGDSCEQYVHQHQDLHIREVSQ